MRYVILYALSSILLIAASVFLAGRIAKARGMKKGRQIRLAVGISLLSITLYNIGYIQIYYHADEHAKASLQGNGKVEVSRIGPDILFDGPGKDNALVFIPGARVEETAYAPLLLTISEQGIDCFLLKVPSRMATFGLYAPDRIIENYAYDSWYIAGHSLGGIVAAFYSEEKEEAVDGLILLAAYPTVEIPDSVAMLSIYGDLDGCLSRKRYEECKRNWSTNASEVILKGGNHSQFGNYGLQRGDGEATLSAAGQQTETAERVLQFVSKGNMGESVL